MSRAVVCLESRVHKWACTYLIISKAIIQRVFQFSKVLFFLLFFSFFSFLKNTEFSSCEWCGPSWRNWPPPQFTLFFIRVKFWVYLRCEWVHPMSSGLFPPLAPSTSAMYNMESSTEAIALLIRELKIHPNVLPVVIYVPKEYFL